MDKAIKEFKELTNDIPEEYMLGVSLDNVAYGAIRFEVDVSEKQIILK